MPSDRIPKVSVCVITFNQARYIRECLQSIVEQVTDFDFEVIVSDDSSTDGTAEIVKEFAVRYPDRVIPLIHEEKIGGHENFLRAHNMARGDYVAHCDGDDFFLPGKLQKQSDYLDSHEDCSLTYTRAKIFTDGGDSWEIAKDLPKIFRDYRFHTCDLLSLGAIGIHSTLMYRRSSRKTRQPDFITLDYFYAIEYSLSGYGYYFNDVLAAYRYNVNAGTLTTSKYNQKKNKKLIAKYQLYFNSIAPHLKKHIFIGALTFFLIEAKNFRSSAVSYARNLVTLIVPITMKELISNIMRARAFRIRRV